MLKRTASLTALLFAVLMVANMTTPQRTLARASGDAAAGLEVHKKNCAKCHGPEGKGDGPAGKLLKTKPADWSKLPKVSDDELFKVISKGGAAVGKSALMPGFAEKLSEQDIRNVIAFIRSLQK